MKHIYIIILTICVKHCLAQCIPYEFFEKKEYGSDVKIEQECYIKIKGKKHYECIDLSLLSHDKKYRLELFVGKNKITTSPKISFEKINWYKSGFIRVEYYSKYCNGCIVLGDIDPDKEVSVMFPLTSKHTKCKFVGTTLHPEYYDHHRINFYGIDSVK